MKRIAFIPVFCSIGLVSCGDLVIVSGNQTEDEGAVTHQVDGSNGVATEPSIQEVPPPTEVEVEVEEEQTNESGDPQTDTTTGIQVEGSRSSETYVDLEYERDLQFAQSERQDPVSIPMKLGNMDEGTATGPIRVDCDKTDSPYQWLMSLRLRQKGKPAAIAYDGDWIEGDLITATAQDMADSLSPEDFWDTPLVEDPAGSEMSTAYELALPAGCHPTSLWMKLPSASAYDLSVKIVQFKKDEEAKEIQIFEHQVYKGHTGWEKTGTQTGMEMRQVGAHLPIGDCPADAPLVCGYTSRDECNFGTSGTICIDQKVFQVFANSCSMQEAGFKEAPMSNCKVDTPVGPPVQETCNSDTDYVCGARPGPTCPEDPDNPRLCSVYPMIPEVFNNKCELKKAQAIALSLDQCADLLPEETLPEPTPRPIESECPAIHDPVCGVVPVCDESNGAEFACITVAPSPKFYGNKCELEKAGAKPLTNEQCAAWGITP